MSKNRYEFRDFEKEMGIRIVTPHDKLDSYFEGLKLIENRPGCETAEAAQWEAIGDQYVRLSDSKQAQAAFESALLKIKKADSSQFANAEQRREWQNNLREKLRKLSGDG